MPVNRQTLSGDIDPVLHEIVTTLRVTLTACRSVTSSRVTRQHQNILVDIKRLIVMRCNTKRRRPPSLSELTSYEI